MSIPDLKAVVSHESALDLLGLSDVIPNKIHLTVPRTMRKTPDIPGVRIHTTKRQLQTSDVVVRDGMRITSPERSIVDSAEAGTQPEQIVMAAYQAVSDGMTTTKRLQKSASDRSSRVRELIDRAVLEIRT